MKNISLTLIFSVPVSMIVGFFEKYIFADWEFVKWLVILMLIDTLLGFIKHWFRHDLSSRAWGMVAKKIIIYSSVLALTHVLSNFCIAGIQMDSFLWFRTFACSALIVREALSIIENVEEIYPGFFPSWIVKRFKEFDSDTAEKLKRGKNESE